MTESPYILLNECRDRYQKIVAREAAEAAREQYEKYAEILKIPDILTRLDNMENKLEELERKIADGDKQMAYAYRIRVHTYGEKATRIFGINRLKANSEACVRECEGTMQEVSSFLKKINCPYRIEDLKEKDFERLIITIEVTDTEKQPQLNALVDEINDPVSRFKPY